MEFGFFSCLCAVILGLGIATLPFSFLVNLSLLFASSFTVFGVQELLSSHFGKRKADSFNYDELIKFSEETKRRKNVFGKS